MIVAIVGSRGLVCQDFSQYLPASTTKIISGGAKGIDQAAREFAAAQNIPFQEYLPEYHRYGRAAPLKRNLLLVENADLVLAFWDGISHGTQHTIACCQKLGVPVRIITLHPPTGI